MSSTKQKAFANTSKLIRTLQFLFLFILLLNFYQSIGQTNPKFSKIRKYGRKDQTIKALALINDYIKKDTTSSEAYQLRSQFLRQTGKYDLAYKDAQKALQLDSNNYKAYTEFATIHVMQDKYDEALKLYNKAVAINSGYSSAYTCRGGLYFYYLSNNAKALSDYNKAIELDKRSDGAYYNRGLLYNEFREYDKAIPDFSKSLRILRKYPKAHFDRGVSYYNTGKYKKALKDFKKAMKYNSKINPYERMKESDITEWMNDCRTQMKK